LLIFFPQDGGQGGQGTGGRERVLGNNDELWIMDSVIVWPMDELFDLPSMGLVDDSEFLKAKQGSSDDAILKKNDYFYSSKK